MPTSFKDLPPAAYLREIFSYDPDSGYLLRKKAMKSIKAGSRAGSLTAEGYISIRLDRRYLMAHRVIFKMMTGRDPIGEIDHANCDRADNRWLNLREATPAQNQHNTKRKRTNKSGFKGAVARHSKWEANIRINGRVMCLGRFPTPEEAHAAYTSAARQNFGKYARTA